MKIENHFDALHFTECDIEGFELSHFDLTVMIARGLHIFDDHSLKDVIGPNDPCRAHFLGVVYAHRSLDIYTPDRSGFAGTQNIIDLDRRLPLEQAQATKRFSIEGVWKTPPAWMQWDIDAASFVLEVID